MSENAVFQPEKIQFKIMGQEYNYEFIPSIHLNEVMIDAAKLLTSFDFFEDDKGNLKPSVKDGDNQVISRMVEVLQDLFSKRIYQVIADILEHHNGAKFSLDLLKMKSRPTEIANFMAIVMDDAEIYEAIATLGKSLAGLMGKVAQIKSP